MNARKIIVLIIILLLVLIVYKVYTHISYEYKVKKALELLKNQPVIDIYCPANTIVIKKI
ncbi:hypothetical protein [Desulfurella sp.]|uniref:hypothetical protein n=1 Tax=Desulfurella sp. TaxID=1962857 RepID=UPI0025BE6DCA|nr:hypothetical protein [Desulfurella sp.]